MKIVEIAIWAGIAYALVAGAIVALVMCTMVYYNIYLEIGRWF